MRREADQDSDVGPLLPASRDIHLFQLLPLITLPRGGLHLPTNDQIAQTRKHFPCAARVAELQPKTTKHAQGAADFIKPCRLLSFYCKNRDKHRHCGTVFSYIADLIDIDFPTNSATLQSLESGVFFVFYRSLFGNNAFPLTFSLRIKIPETVPHKSGLTRHCVISLCSWQHKTHVINVLVFDTVLYALHAIQTGLIPRWACLT